MYNGSRKPSGSNSFLLSSPQMLAIMWMLLVEFTSSTNDMLVKLVGNLDSVQVSFLRFLFGVVTLLPFLYRGCFKEFLVINHWPHLLRTILGVVGLITATHAAQHLPLPQVALIFYTVPLFGLVFAKLILKERIGIARSLAAAVGFIGTFITLIPDNILGDQAILGPNNALSSTIHDSLPQRQNSIPLISILIPFLGAILFALSDILIKKMVSVRNENKMFMLFHFSLGACILSFIPAMAVWQSPTLQQWGVTMLLGVGANLIQLFLFYAFAYTEISALVPFRYIGLLFASLYSWFLFGHAISMNTILGALLIVPAMIFIGYQENKSKA